MQAFEGVVYHCHGDNSWRSGREGISISNEIQGTEKSLKRAPGSEETRQTSFN
jgi:hypothetical protein